MFFTRTGLTGPPHEGKTARVVGMQWKQQIVRLPTPPKEIVHGWQGHRCCERKIPIVVPSNDRMPLGVRWRLYVQEQVRQFSLLLVGVSAKKIAVMQIIILIIVIIMIMYFIHTNQGLVVSSRLRTYQSVIRT